MTVLPIRKVMPSMHAVRKEQVFAGHGRNLMWSNPFTSNNAALAVLAWWAWFNQDLAPQDFPLTAGIALRSPWLQDFCSGKDGYPLPGTLRMMKLILAGRTIGCSCAAHEICHADLLIAWANDAPINLPIANVDHCELMQFRNQVCRSCTTDPNACPHIQSALSGQGGMPWYRSQQADVSPILACQDWTANRQSRCNKTLDLFDAACNISTADIG